jgi:hypothetical protein
MTIDDTATGEDLRASRLLDLCRARRRRAVDALIEHLEASGPGALEALLALGPGLPLARAGGGPLPLAVAREVHARSKQGEPASAAEHLGRMAAYFTAIAAALGEHGVLLTRHARRDLDPILVDLAAVTAGPWQELYLRALRRGQGDPPAGGRQE